MNTLPGRPEDIHLFYPQAGAFVGYLVERFGNTSVAGVFTDLDSGVRIDEAVQSALGFQLEDLDAAFRRSVGAPATATTSPPSTPAPSATPASPVPMATPTAVAGSPDAGGDGFNILPYLVVAGAAGLLLGTAIGRWRRRRRR